MPLLTKSELTNIFDAFSQKKIMVIGDVMLDSYLWGSVNRMSPEAPVPVLLLNKRENRLGGAANVALNLKKLGATPLLFSVTGDDAEGDELVKLLLENEIGADYIIHSPGRPTTLKSRVIGNNQQQLIRVDSETEEPITDSETNTIKSLFDEVIGELDAIVFEDYDKGLLNAGLIEYIITEANKKNIPSIIDPKKKNFFNYREASLFKPNLKEIKEGLGFNFSKPVPDSELIAATEMLISRTAIKNVMITLADEGIFISNGQTEFHISTHKRSIFDVSGAGDTVAAVAALALSCFCENRMIAEIANIAGGLVCEKVGVVPANKEDLFSECAKILC